MKDNLNLINLISFIIVIVIFILSIDVTFQYIFGYNIFGMNSVGNRPSSLFGDELILGSFVARLFPLGLIFLFSLPEKNKNFFFIIYSLICFIAIIVSQERTAFVLFLFAQFLLVITIKEFRKFFIYFFFSALIFISILLLSKSSILERLINHTINQSHKGNHIYLYSERHTDHILTAINMIKTKPLIGHGNKSFRFLCNKPPYSVKDIKTERNIYYSEHEQIVTIIPVYHVKKVKGIEEDYLDSFIIKLSEDKRAYTTTEIDKLYIPFEIKVKRNDFTNDQLGKIENQHNFLITSGIIFIDGINNSNHSKVFYLDSKTNKLIELNNLIKINNFINQKNYVYNLKKGEKIFSFKGQYIDGCNTHPHHLYFQVLSENGLINFSIIILLLFSIIFLLIKENKKKHKNIKNYNIKCVLLIMGMISLFPFVPSGNFFNNWMSIVHFLPIGIYFATTKENQ
ncbi:O-antigen ligase family protein [Candidatus Pelagibacter ubique]|nr:O-antigen ligase family protein [Candidatus Pelagibacter ubique]